MQKRLARRLDLELILSKVKPHPAPKADLEQYTISVDTAATILYLAAYMNEDIVGKKVIDLGCGTGRLALGAAFLGATEVVGADIDTTALKTAFENSVNVGLKRKTQWIAADVQSLRGRFHTVLQNPPFGVQTRKADRKFIVKALEMGEVVYSVHKRQSKDTALATRLKTHRQNAIAVPPSPFMKEFVEQSGGEIEATYALMMTVPYTFNFHTKKKHQFVTDLYVIHKN